MQTYALAVFSDILRVFLSSFRLRGRLIKRGRLGSLIFFLRVGLDHGRLSRVVARVSSLEAVTNINAGVLAALRDGQSTGPSEGADHVNGVANCLALAALSVLLSVANNFAKPSWLLTGELGVLTDISEALASRVFGFKIVNRSLQVILGHIRGQMGAAARLQDDRVHVCPCLDVSELIGLGEGKLLSKLVFVSLIIKCEEALGHKGGSMEDTSKSRSEQVALLAAEGRVSHDFSV
jgi:hypothetical protein|mmetsp:Transcript_43689/g.57882  ORF Transcript_43689/g.57882 Transcript_43689/m.57882 type:complete len:236 (-) Transcript_43689:752-1459(-)